jgi:hypothetical protein
VDDDTIKRAREILGAEAQEYALRRRPSLAFYWTSNALVIEREGGGSPSRALEFTAEELVEAADGKLRTSAAFARIRSVVDLITVARESPWQP